MTLSRPVRVTLIGVAICGLVALLFSLWLVRSGGGRDWLLARLVGVMPAGSTLRWDGIDGSLAGPLEIRGLHYDFKGSRFDAQRLRIDHGFWPLLSGRLDVRTLTLEHALWVLPPDDKPFELPRWPDMLPALDMPITVAVHRLVVRDLRVHRGSERLARISRIDGGLTLGPGRLHLDKIVLVSDRGVLRVAGDYLPHDNFRTALSGRVVFPAVPDAPAAVARFTARGNLDRFELALDGNAPAPLTLRLRLSDGRGKPHWSLDTASAQLVPAQLGLGDAVALAFDLHVLGAGGNASVRGKLKRADLAAEIAPSQLRVADGVLSFAPLALRVPQGSLALTGAVVLRGEDPYFNLRLRSRALTLAPAAGNAGAAPVTGNGELRMRGHWRDWSVGGAVNLLRARQTATVTLSGRGDATHLSVQSLLAKTPTGTLRGTGELHWQPRLRLVVDSTLTGFDPGYFLPDYPGAVSGRIAGQATRDAQGSWYGDASVNDLRGTLRRRPLQGQAQLRFAGATVSGQLGLRLGDSRVDAAGSVGERMDVTAKFSPFDLHDLWPDASGRLQGSVIVRGTRAAPNYQADLRGDALHWNQFRAGSLQVHGQLPATGSGGDLRLSARAFVVSGMAFDTASLALIGSVAALQAKASVSGDAGSFSGEASASRTGAQWQGRLAQLRLAPKRGAPWSLQAPAGYRYQDGALQLDQACLASAAGGSVCAQATGSRATVRGNALPWLLLQPWMVDTSLGLQPFGNVDFNGEFVRAKQGTWDGQLHLQSTTGGLRLDPQATRALLAYSNLRLDARLQQSRVTVALDAALAEGGSVHGSAQLAGLSSTAPLQGKLQMDVRQLEWLELFSADLAGPTGDLSGSLVFAGTLGAPSLSGDARLSRFAAELPALGIALSAGEFALHGDPGGQARISGHVLSGKGTLQVDGTLNLRDRNSPLELHLTGQDIAVSDTPQLQATMSPDLRLRYNEGTLQIRGTVGVPSARLDLERLDQSVSVSPDVVVLDPVTPAKSSVFLVDTDVELHLGEAVRLRGFGLDGQLGGTLRVRDRPGRAAQATGTLNVSGRYSAYGRALEIKRGRLSYVNSAYDNPALDIVAEHEFEEVTVGVRVRGSALAPETTITSSPSMATAEALSWLVIGRPLSSASGSEMQQISASSLALSAGSNLLAQRIGSRLGLDAAGVVETRALGASTFMVGKQVSPRLFVSYGVSLIGIGQVVTLKYLLRRGLDVSLESGTVETAGSLNWHKEK